MTGLDFIRTHREEIQKIAARHGVRRILVFGSFVRGEDRPESDIDFLVEIGPRTSGWFPGGLIVELEALLGRSVQVVTERGLSDLLRERVHAEAIPL